MTPIRPFLSPAAPETPPSRRDFLRSLAGTVLVATGVQSISIAATDASDIADDFVYCSGDRLYRRLTGNEDKACTESPLRYGNAGMMMDWQVEETLKDLEKADLEDHEFPRELLESLSEETSYGPPSEDEPSFFWRDLWDSVVLAPLNEEFFFRYIPHKLHRLAYPEDAGLAPKTGIATTLVFGYVHNFARLLTGRLAFATHVVPSYQFFAGGIFWYLVRTKSIGHSILGHSAWNALAMIRARK